MRMADLNGCACGINVAFTPGVWLVPGPLTAIAGEEKGGDLPLYLVVTSPTTNSAGRAQLVAEDVKLMAHVFFVFSESPPVAFDRVPPSRCVLIFCEQE